VGWFWGQIDVAGVEAIGRNSPFGAGFARLSAWTRSTPRLAKGRRRFVRLLLSLFFAIVVAVGGGCAYAPLRAKKLLTTFTTFPIGRREHEGAIAALSA
jgi:hypothetical protein